MAVRREDPDGARPTPAASERHSLGQPESGPRAATSDRAILEAAKRVFVDDPRAPVAAVASRAGVGMSAVYRRYASKEDLLRRLCHDGLLRYIGEAERGLAEADPVAGLTQFVTAVVDADVHSLTVYLGGTFTPTEEMGQAAMRAGALANELVDRVRAAGRLRAGAVAEDIGFILEACAAIRLPDPDRTAALRARILTLLLDGLVTGRDLAAALPEPAPAPGESAWRWRRSARQ
jgi:AcrR family transcriptional regulator